MEEANRICENHGTEMKYIPPGVSKRTGKPYQGFFACDTCNDEKKASRGTSGSNSDVLEALRKTYAKLDELESRFSELLKKLSVQSTQKEDDNLPVVEL